MLEELLENQEISNSILIVDEFENDATPLFYIFIEKLAERTGLRVNLFPSDPRSFKQLSTRFSNQCTVKRTLLDKLLIDFEKPLFEQVLSELTENEKNLIVFDNINLIIRHYDGNPYDLFGFLVSLRKNPAVSGILMVVHKDSINESIISQYSRAVQTFIEIVDTKISMDDMKRFASVKNRNLLKYQLSIDNRSPRNTKPLTYDETLYLTDNLEIVKIEKNIKKKNEKTSKEVEEEEDPLKGLTFNVHLSSEELEAKRNLVLPYEIIGKQKVEPKQETHFEESKIFYAPDERDDVDDDDPDDDLNF